MMTSQQWGYSEIAEFLGVQVRSVQRYRTRGEMPDPDGKIGSTPWWWSDTITEWHRRRPGRTGRPKKTPETNTH